MMRFLINLISRLGGVQISSQIPAGYVVRMVCEKGVERIYAMIRLWTLRGAYINPTSTIKASSMLKFQPPLLVGRECYIDALGEEGIVCGSRVSFGFRTTMIVTGSLNSLGKGIRIGNNVGLGSFGLYGGAGGVEIGDDTIFGNYVSVHPENHNYERRDIPIRLQGVNHKGIKIGKGCWIGAKATILDGTVIGDGCIVAAGAVVSGVFPDNVIIGGVPAKIIKSR